jgi:hypothetical protein
MGQFPADKGETKSVWVTTVELMRSILDCDGGHRSGGFGAHR